MYSADDIKRMEELKKLEILKKQILMKALTKEAAERLSLVRAANPSVASQAENYIIQIQQSGKLLKPITEAKLKEILTVLTPAKREFKIKRK